MVKILSQILCGGSLEGNTVRRFTYEQKFDLDILLVESNRSNIDSRRDNIIEIPPTKYSHSTWLLTSKIPYRVYQE